MIKQTFFAVVIGASSLALSIPASAQDGGWKAPKKDQEKQKPDPCAHERSQYPWGMGPCRKMQLQMENARKKSPEELREDEKALQNRTQHNKNVPINQK